MMCRQCDGSSITRRAFCAGLMGAALSVTDTQAATGLVEPRLHLGAGDRAHPTIALTLDACSGQTDHRVLDFLIARQIPATLFLTAIWMTRNEQALARLKAHPTLFAIGNHGGRHLAAIWGQSAPFGVRAAGSPQAVLEEVRTGYDAIHAYFGLKPRWFRGATAMYSQAALPLIAAEGYAIAGYSLNGDAGATLSASAVAHRIVQAQDGDVILAHLNHPERPSGTGLVAGLEALIARGVRFGSLEAVWQVTHAKQV
jgi:peptidoglycan/xylan/chitin deacetylase (PgdA/CDA1 family)